MKEKVYRWIDENEGEVVKLLQELIRIPSVNPYFDEDKQYMQEGKAQAYLKEYLEDYASPETKKIGEELIAKEILKVPNEKVRAKAMEYLSELNDGKRDFRF